MSALEQCPVCDRPQATADDWMRCAGGEGEHLCWADAASPCAGPRVDWRARALAAERQRDEANAARDTLRERVAEEIGLRLDGHGDDDLAAEAGEVRRERDEARWLLAAAARGDLPRCDECPHAATLYVATTAGEFHRCDAHAGGDEWETLPHAAALRAAMGGAK